MTQIIAHRGLTTGDSFDGLLWQNNINQIIDILKTTNFGVEFDIRSDYNEEGKHLFYLSHDDNFQGVNRGYNTFNNKENFDYILSHPRSFIHAKDSESYIRLRKTYPDSEIFYHETEPFVFTSKSRKLLYPHLYEGNTIWNQPELEGGNDWVAKFTKKISMFLDCPPVAILTKHSHKVQSILTKEGLNND